MKSLSQTLSELINKHYDSKGYAGEDSGLFQQALRDAYKTGAMAMYTNDQGLRDQVDAASDKHAKEYVDNMNQLNEQQNQMAAQATDDEVHRVDDMSFEDAHDMGDAMGGEYY